MNPSSIQDEETYQERDRRIRAANILANYEQLVWLSMARNESIVQTRLHYEAIFAGLPSANRNVRWPTEHQSTGTGTSTSSNSANRGVALQQGKSPAGKGKSTVIIDSHSRRKSSNAEGAVREGGSSPSPSSSPSSPAVRRS